MLRCLFVEREGDDVVSNSSVEYLDPWEGNNWPDWTDSQRKIDAVFDNGGIILDGTLVVDDFGFDGEDEYPIFVIIDSQGDKHSFCDVAKYHFVA